MARRPRASPMMDREKRMVPLTKSGGAPDEFVLLDALMALSFRSSATTTCPR